MIGVIVTRTDGSVERYPVCLLDRARQERSRGASYSERAADTLDVIELAHIAAQRAGDARSLDEWAAGVQDIDIDAGRPTSPADTPSAG